MNSFKPTTVEFIHVIRLNDKIFKQFLEPSAVALWFSPTT